MEGAAHDPEIAEKLGIPQGVARDFVEADRHSESWKKREKVKKALEDISTLAFQSAIQKARGQLMKVVT